MRGEYLVKILEFLKDQAVNQMDFWDAVLASGYGASMSKIDYEYNKIRRAREIEQLTRAELANRRKRLGVYLSKMKHDGLIQETAEGKTAIIKITRKGKAKLALLSRRLPERKYKSQTQNKFTIISFDIPEKMRRKRDWFREVIRNLQFRMIHQSVWVGKTKIPRELVEDLENLKILEFVEVFEISKSGTLKKLGEK